MMLESLRRFLDNPVLRREALVQLGLAGRKPWRRLVFWSIALGFIAVFSAFTMTETGLSAQRWSRHGSVVYGTAWVCNLFAPWLTFGAISGERERGTWDTLRSTQLPPISLVVGKWLGNLAPTVLIWVALLPLRIATGWDARVGFGIGLVEESLLVTGIGMFGAAGLGVSCWRRTTAEAGGSLVFLWFACQLLTLVARASVTTSVPRHWMTDIGPLLATTSPWTVTYGLQPLANGSLAPGVSVAISGILFANVGITALVLRSVARRVTAVG